MLNRKKQAMRIMKCALVALLILGWMSIPTLAIVQAIKVDAVDSQREEFTSVENESTTPTVESDPSIGPEEIAEDQGEVSLEEEEIITESVAEEVVNSDSEKQETIAGFTLTEEEREMLAAIIYLEGRGESFECQLAIGSVVLNRLHSRQWGDTLEKVLYAKGQFTPAKHISKTTPNKMQYDVVDQLLETGTTIPYYVLYFRADHYFANANDYDSFDNTYFSYLEKDK